MCEYKYTNNAERERTQKFEGIYTPQEIELNKQLANACSKDIIDFVLVENLLKQGADPLGGTELFGWDLLEHIYGDTVACYSQDFNCENFPQLTELFLKYGMDVDNPRIPYDGDFSLNPLWHFAHITNEYTIMALKMLLDNGLSAESFMAFWDHAFTDYRITDCADPQNDPYWNYHCSWTIRMLLLGASYEHILNASDRLRELICFEYNNYDLSNFRNWNDYEYYFDTSQCGNKPHIFGSILHITDRKTSNEVWKMGIGFVGRKALAQ